MEVKKAIKKIIALGAGATMVGTTIMAAMAASLASYPAPFIKDGKFDAMLVVGDQAKAEDVIGATDIAMSLQYGMKTTKSVSTGGATSVVVEGDALKIAESTNKLEINESLSTIKSSVTATDLKALAGGSITNEKGTYSYTETIDLPSAKIRYLADPDDDTDTVADYLVLNQSAAYTYKVTFSPALKSDVTATTHELNDLDNKDITLLGKKYTFLNPKEQTGELSQTMTLTLMGGATKDIMEEGATKTFTINGKDYEVTVDWIGTASAVDKAKFTINGETTDSLAGGETYKLSDATQIGVTDVLQNEAGETAGGDKVEFNLGADKIEIKDTNTTLSTYASECQVTVGSESLGNVVCNIKSTDSTAAGDEVQISEIDFRYVPSDNIYVANGKGASAIADANEGEAGNFITSSFDIQYKGLEIPKTEKISLTPSGNDNYKLGFTNKAGVKYNTEVFALESGGNISLGKISGSTLRALVLTENTSINDEDFFVVSKNKYTRILQFKDVNTADKVIKIKDVGSDVTNEVTYTTAGLTGNLVLDGNTYKVNISADSSTATIVVDLDASGAIGTTTLSDNAGQIWTELGAAINLSIGANSTGTYNDGIITVLSEDKEDNTKDTITQQFYRTSDAKIDLNGTSAFVGCYEPTSLTVSLQDSDKYVCYTKYGIKITQDRKSSTTADQDDMNIVYPDSQVFGAAYITSGVVKATSSGTSGDITTQEIVKIDVGASKLASEVAGDETKNNLILVGGPCANAAAMVIMGNPEVCTTGFEAGKAKIKLYENSGKVAMLVAGATALDTRGAAQFVAQYDKNKATFAGATDEIALTVTSLSSITASIPTKTA